MSVNYDEEHTIPHVTRDDALKTGLYAFVGLSIAGLLLIGTIWLFTIG